MGQKILVPGMPVDLYLKTGEHSPMTYLMKPFRDYFSKSLLEWKVKKVFQVIAFKYFL